MGDPQKVLREGNPEVSDFRILKQAALKGRLLELKRLHGAADEPINNKRARCETNESFDIINKRSAHPLQERGRPEHCMMRNSEVVEIRADKVSDKDVQL